MDTPPFPYSFESFCIDVVVRVQRINSRLRKPDATWPGALFLDVPGQALDISFYRVAGLTELDKHRLALMILPERIRSSRARRFCWMMPAWRGNADPLQESLVLVFGERGRRAILLADVHRDDRQAPKFGRWQPGPEGRVPHS
jgi:hypothetical protein